MNIPTHFSLVMALVFFVFSACQQYSTDTSPSATATQKRATITCSEPTSTNVATPTTQLDPDIEEYAIYSALLNYQIKGENTKQVLIVDQTQVEKQALLERNLDIIQEEFSLAPELLESFKVRNQEPNPLQPNLDLNLEYQLLSQEQIDELQPLDEASGWELYYEKYPQSVGFIYLSRVGFNDDLSQALVYFSQYRYEQPIRGGYYLLNRQDRDWEVEVGYEWITQILYQSSNKIKNVAW